MTKNRVMLWLLLTGLLLSTSLNAQEFPYQDATLPVEERVADLLSRMSLEEKVRQMDMYNGSNLKNKESFSIKFARQIIGTELGAGSVHDFYPRDARTVNDLQRFVIENNRWGIPALVFCEFLHGYTGEGSTAFPMNIGLGATWDKDLLNQIGKVIGSEGRAHGVHFGLGPNLDLGREPRWGRIAETFGEDTHLAAELGTSLIRGIQGDSLSADRAMIAEPKHFAAHGSPQSGGNAGPVLLGERSVRDEYLPVFRQAFLEGGALGTMAAYSEIDGIPNASNQWLLNEVLRNEWGFKGIVVSDLGAIRFLQSSHRSSDSHRESIRQAIAAGIDMQFYDFPNDEFQQTLIDLVNEGDLDIAHINRAVSGVLRLKFLLGLFENPYTTQALIDERNHSPENQQLALKAGLQSMVLLKNENQLLPLSKDLKKVAVLGPLANESVLGGYAVRNKKAITVYEGIRELLKGKAEVSYEEGVPLIYKGQPVPGANLRTVDGEHNGLNASYFNNRQLDGTPALSKIDSEVAFTWPESPAEGVVADQFSVRWEGQLVPDESFDGWIGVSSDDGVRLWVEDKLVIDNWAKGATNIETAPMNFEKEKPYKVKMEMWEGGYGAKAFLLWNKVKPDLSESVALAKEADVAIIVIGETRELVEENRDVTSLDLYGLQQAFVDEILATGTPVVCVLLNGRPLSINSLEQKVPAILEAWFPGEKGGEAVAMTLFGDHNPAGRLPVTVPRNVGQLPMYYSAKPTRNHRYVDEKITPLYPFGYGLSYSRFEYSGLEVTDHGNGSFKVAVKLTNVSQRAGEEVVQLYLTDVISSVTTPVKELKGFERIILSAGESRRVEFTLSPEDLALWNRQMNYVAEAGEFRVMVGPNSQEGMRAGFTLKTSIEIDR